MPTSAQTDYNLMSNWAFHPNKAGTLLEGYNLNIAVIDENLNTTAVIENTNNAMTNTGVDVFFIHPTALLNMSSYTNIENVPIPSQNTFTIISSIIGQAGLLAKYGRLFAPRYQQATPPTFLNSPLNDHQANILGIAYNDVKAAFLNYLNNHNNGNKIILASHSQGAYHAGFLLRDVFDNNPNLRSKLVVAVIAGIASNYGAENTLNGGWWQNIPFCSQQNECGCVIGWRSYKDGQIPPRPIASHPAKNTNIVNNNWVYNRLNVLENWLYQDSLFYGDNFSSLQNFITLKNNVNFGGDVGFVAFNDLYQIKYLRTSPTQVGFVVKHTPKSNDLRPNLLLLEESNPSFNTLGYHNRDYNIYSSALMTQIDLKLATCNKQLNTSTKIDTAHTLAIIPNPTRGNFTVVFNLQVMGLVSFKIFDVNGKLLFEQKNKAFNNGENSFSFNLANKLADGLYFLKVESNEFSESLKVVVE